MLLDRFLLNHPHDAGGCQTCLAIGTGPVEAFHDFIKTGLPASGQSQPEEMGSGAAKPDAAIAIESEAEAPVDWKPTLLIWRRMHNNSSRVPWLHITLGSELAISVSGVVP